MGELLHVIVYPEDRPVDIRASTDKFVRELDEYLGWAQADIAQYNANVTNTARTAVEARRERIKRQRERLAASGLPLGDRGKSPKTYIPDAIVRRPGPVLTSSTQANPIALEPVLGDKIFEHILSVIRSVGGDMERSTNTYSGLSEEDLRHVFVAALNPHYKGQATAEAFNFEGKTDLLIRHEGRNLFIGEFKIWSGVKGLGETIDQLFKYVAWRDTKLAIVIFVREKNLTEIFAKARNALSEHPRFVRALPAATETELRAKMNWVGDEQRLADLNICFVHLPSRAS
jgi:hypothetical protein